MYRGMIMIYLLILLCSNCFASDNSNLEDLPFIARSIVINDTQEIPQASITSYWDKTTALEHDYIVIGAGIVGLSTAIEVKKAKPRSKVLVLERGALACGASSRNAGFMCFGSLTEICEDIAIMGESKALQQVKDRWNGLQLLRAEFGDVAIGFKQTGNYEIISSVLLSLLDRVQEINKFLQPIFHSDVFVNADEKIEQFGFPKKYVSALIYNRFEGQLNSGLLMRAFNAKAQNLGIIIRYGCKALRPYRVDCDTFVPVIFGEDSKKMNFKARRVAICINGFTKDLLPEVDIQPGRGQILVTAPTMKTTQLPQVPFHIGKGFWYFRLLDDNRILIGGGRNLDFADEETTELGTTEKIINPLMWILSNIITPGIEHRIDFAWSGIMGFSGNHQPIIKRIRKLSGVVIGFGCNGMGIARGYDTGKKTAQLLLDEESAKL